jgi:peptidyl-prolyl cis-trans isomerase D
MRKNAKSWIIVVPVGIIILVFVFFYGFSDVRKGDRDTIIASVGNRKITMAAYRTAYKNMIEFYRTMYKNQFKEDLIEKLGLKQKVLENLIDREILLQEAERQKIYISPEEVRNSIINTQVFQQDGVFSQRVYERVLSYYGVSAMDFEKDKENELKLKILEEMIKNAIKVSEKELRDFYKMQNERVKIDYICFNPIKTQEKPTLSDEEITKFYEEHQEDFRVPEKVKVKYIIFTPEHFQDRVDVTKQEIKEYYETDPELFFEPKTVKAKHILLKVEENTPDEKEEEIKKKAENLLEQLKKDVSFEKLAKKYSEDSASAEKGGDLGYFKKGDMLKPFEETAFSLKPGETSSPVRTQLGYHIIHVEDVKEERTTPFEEASNIIEKEIRKEKAQEAVRKEAKRAFNRLFKSKDIEGYAEKDDFKISETGYFSYGNSPEDMPGKEQFSKEAFALSIGELAPAFAIDQKFFLLKLEDRKESHIPLVGEIKDAIKKEVEKDKKLQITKEKAKQALSQLLEGEETWQDLVKKHDLQIKKAEFKRMGDYISGIGSSKEIKDAAFVLKKTKQYAPKTFLTDKGVLIIRLRERQVPKDSDYEKDKEKTTQTVLQNKKEEVFDQFLQELKLKSELWVNRKILPSV